MSTQKCKSKKCKVSPKYGNKEDEIPTYCRKHKLKDMVNLNGKDKWCDYKGCATRKNFGYEGKEAKFCKKHKKENMCNVNKNKISKSKEKTLTRTKHIKRFLEEFINITLKKNGQTNVMLVDHTSYTDPIDEFPVFYIEFKNHYIVIDCDKNQTLESYQGIDELCDKVKILIIFNISKYIDSGNKPHGTLFKIKKNFQESTIIKAQSYRIYYLLKIIMKCLKKKPKKDKIIKLFVKGCKIYQRDHEKDKEWVKISNLGITLKNKVIPPVPISNKSKKNTKKRKKNAKKRTKKKKKKSNVNNISTISVSGSTGSEDSDNSEDSDDSNEKSTFNKVSVKDIDEENKKSIIDYKSFDEIETWSSIQKKNGYTGKKNKAIIKCECDNKEYSTANKWQAHIKTKIHKDKVDKNTEDDEDEPYMQPPDDDGDEDEVEDENYDINSDNEQELEKASDSDDDNLLEDI
jgi:hypothetical protein